MKTSPLLRTARIAALFCVASCVIPAAQAQCTLTIVSVKPCDKNGTPAQPHVGDIYWLRVDWKVTGTPKSAYKVRFSEANLTWDWVPGVGTGSYWGYTGWQLPLAGPIPYKITLDPDHVSGNTDLAHSVAKGNFTPIPPVTAVSTYDTKQYQGTETFTVNFTPGGGTIDHGFTLLGVPTSGSFQKVIASTGPTGATQVTTSPNGDPVWQTNHGAMTPTTAAHSWADTQNFTVQVSSVAVNPLLLNKATWTQLTTLTPDLLAWTKADKLVQSTDPAIASFVNGVLPATYQKTMTPYTAARALFLAVVKDTTYQSPPNTDSSAVSTLNAKEGDCLGFSTLFAAACRHIGIPSRTLCGWWKGQNQWHCIMEFYLPGAGWIPADGSEDKLWWDPSGTYACLFGDHPNLNQLCEVSRGSDHHTSTFSATELQVGWFWYWGTDSYSGVSDTCSLQ